MSIFSKKNNQFTESEDLDSGYNNRYYSQKETSRDRNDRDLVRNRRADGEGGTDFYTGRSSDRAAMYDAPAAPSGANNIYEEEENARNARNRGYEEPSYARIEKEEKPTRPVNQGTLYYTPEGYADVRTDIVCGVAENHVVIVNIRNLMGTDELVRLLDYIMGAMQVLGATLRRWGGSNLLLIPAGVEIDEEDLVIPEEEPEIFEEDGEDFEGFDEE